MYPYDGAPRTSLSSGTPAAVQAFIAASALAVDCVEFRQASLRGAFGPGLDEAAAALMGVRKKV